MNLIISVIIHVIQKMGRGSPKAGIPPLVPKRLDACMLKCIVSMATRSEFYVLLGPIYCNSNGKRNESVFPEQCMIDKNAYTQRKVNQSKKVSPDKLERPLWFTPNVFLLTGSLFHCLRLLSGSREYVHLFNTLSYFLIKTNGSSMKETGVNKP